MVDMGDLDDLKWSSFGFRSPLGRPRYFSYSALVSFFLGRLGRPVPASPGLGRPVEFDVNLKVNQDALGDLQSSTYRKLRLT